MSEQHDYDGISYRKEKCSPGAFRLLFTILVIWGVGYMGYYLFSGWSSQAEADAARGKQDSVKQMSHVTTESSAKVPMAEGDKVEAYVAAGKKLYASLCSSCHGENVKGGFAPDLTTSKYKYGKSRLDIAKSITDGRPGGMPGFKGQVDKEQVEGLVEFLLSQK